MARQVKLNMPESIAKKPSLCLHDVILDILRKYGPQKDAVLAKQLDASESHLSEVKGGKTKKHWPDEWLDYIVDHYDFEAQVAAYYAARRGLTVSAPRKMLPREELRRIKYALSKHNGLGKAVYDEAMSLPDELFADEEEP